MNMIGLSPGRTLAMDPSVSRRERPPRVVECLFHLANYLPTAFAYQGIHPLRGEVVVYQKEAFRNRQMPIIPPKYF